MCVVFAHCLILLLRTCICIWFFHLALLSLPYIPQHDILLTIPIVNSYKQLLFHCRHDSRFVNHLQRDTRHDSRCSKTCIIGNMFAFRFHIEKCSLCYDLTHSTPGFAADPNNCAQFYMCEHIGELWHASLMVCPNCTFWNQDILSCDTVDPSCYKSVSVFTDEAHTGMDCLLIILRLLLRLLFLLILIFLLLLIIIFLLLVLVLLLLLLLLHLLLTSIGRLFWIAKEML